MRDVRILLEVYNPSDFQRMVVEAAGTKLGDTYCGIDDSYTILLDFGKNVRRVARILEILKDLGDDIGNIRCYFYNGELPISFDFRNTKVEVAATDVLEAAYEED